MAEDDAKKRLEKELLKYREEQGKLYEDAIRQSELIRANQTGPWAPYLLPENLSQSAGLGWTRSQNPSLVEKNGKQMIASHPFEGPGPVLHEIGHSLSGHDEREASVLANLIAERSDKKLYENYTKSKNVPALNTYVHYENLKIVNEAIDAVSKAKNAKEAEKIADFYEKQLGYQANENDIQDGRDYSPPGPSRNRLRKVIEHLKNKGKAR